MSWTELRALLRWLPPDPSSALFRAVHPKSWWYTAEVEFAAAILHALENANWQRAGGKGTRPKPFTRPVEDTGSGARAHISIASTDELTARRDAFRTEMARRAERRSN